MDFYWDADVARFRRANGQFVSAADVRRLSEQSITELLSFTDSLASRVANNNISVVEWQAEMRELIKREYIRQYLVGRGGRSAMQFADWGSIGGMLSQTQYNHLTRFAGQIAAGQLTEAQIAARARMYIRSAKQAYEKANKRSKLQAGYEWVSWNLTPAEHCGDCIDFASLGWQRVDTSPFGGCVPCSGCTTCLTNCKCFLSWSKGGEVQQLDKQAELEAAKGE